MNNTVLWILQIVLALAFAGAGTVKLLQPPEKLAQTLGGWVDDMPAGLLKPLGAAEVLGAVGLVAPMATGVATVLTPVAAAGLALIMLGAFVIHARRGEYLNTTVNVVLAVMALTVAWGRFGGQG